ncbi:MAG: rhomboid family intramembrane serine protease [Pedobacter sp.]|nr:MAG: rhomboid family intramembrane serine protease [Pedobacter sp.]
MAISWGYSPKIEKYIPLGDFPIDKYLIIAKQAIENLGWKLSHISESGIIAYTPLSFQSYSEEISIRINANFALVKSECIGIQMFFNDYGKNDANLENFFHEFEYVEYHLKDIWDESLAKFHEFIATQDDDYFEKAPLTAKNKIKNVLYLFYPHKGYLVTPILIIVNIIAYGIFAFGSAFIYRILYKSGASYDLIEKVPSYFGANSRELVLKGQVWRLITHQFLHGSLLHLFFNMYALAYIGLMVENKLGWKKYFAVYILSGICGGLLSIIFHEINYSIGASGAILGLFGAFLALLLNNSFEKNASKAMLVSTLLVCALMLLNGLRGNTDNWAHVGGITCGFLICFILITEKIGGVFIKPQLRFATAIAVVIVFSAIVLTFTTNYEPKKFFALEKAFKKNSEDYAGVYSISTRLPIEERLRRVDDYGVKVWERNKQIVEEMNALKLNEEHSLIRGYYEKITNKTLAFTKLLYLEAADDVPQYRVKLDTTMAQINRLKEEANNKSNRHWGY